MHRPLPITDLLHRGVFTAQTAYAAGWTRSALAHAVATGRLIRLQHGVFVASELWSGTDVAAARNRFVLRSIGATLATGASVASHLSSAVLASLPTWDVPELPCITVSPRYTGDAASAHLHRATLLRHHVLTGWTVPRTTTARTVVDIAREHGTEDAVVVGDAAVHRELVDGAQLEALAEFCAGWPGMRRARHVLNLLDGRSESPLESVSRLRLPLVGLPAPEPQVRIFSLDGRFLGRLDFYWDEFGVAGEVDGKVKYRDRPDDVIWNEKRRQEPMEDTGLIFVRWGRSDLESMPRLAARLENAFRRGSRRPRSERGWIAQPFPGFAPEIHAEEAG